jgi:hypothetical protein
VMITSCDQEEGIDTDNSAGSKYIVHLRVGTAGEYADYILTEEDIMSGEISATGQGVEQTGWRYSEHTSRTLFSIGYYDDNNCIGYGLDEDGDLYEKGRFIFETTLDVFGVDRDDRLIAMEVPRSGFADRVFHLIDGNTVSVISKVPTRIYENRADSLVAWPTALTVRDDKLYVPFYTLHADGTFFTPSTDTAYVAVYSYPDFTFERYIKDTRMGSVGIYGNTNGLIKTESGDLYAYSSASYACGFTTQQKHSGILRIKDGELEFDDSYFFDVEEKTGGDKLAYFEYVGKGQAIGRLITDDSGLWNYYGTSDICRLVMIDLINQNITPIDDVPVHKGQYAPMLVEDGKVYVNITTDNSADVYEIDLTTSQAMKGASINGREIQSLAKFTY